MIPLKLTLKNFIGIKSGVDKDEIIIDLSDIDADADLVAIVGPNGAGKTTVLDNLHPYRLMPFRSGGYSPRSFSYYDHTYETALKEFEFEQNGKIYRSQLVIKGAIKTKKTEAYLFVKQGEDWAPVKLPDNTVSDGKTETYDQCVNHLCGDPELFFTSTFASQGRRPLSDYTNGEIKSFMTQLLGLEDIEAHGLNSVSVGRGIKSALQGYQSQIGALDELESQKNTLDTDLLTTNTTLRMLSEGKFKARESLKAMTRALADVQSDDHENTSIEVQRNELTARLRRLTQDKTDAESRSISATNQVNVQIEQRTAQQGERITQISNQLDRIQNSIESANTLTSMSDQLDKAESNIEHVNHEVGKINSKIEAVTEQTNQKVRLESQMEAVKNEGATLANQFKETEQRANLVASVPCNDVTEYQSSCPLLSDARNASVKLPMLQQNLKIKRETYGSLSIKYKEIIAKTENATDLNALLKSATDQKQELMNVIARADDIRQAGAQVQSLIQEKEPLDKEYVELNSSKPDVTDLETQLTDIESNKKNQLDQIGASIVKTESELNALPDPSDTSKLSKAQKAVDDAEADLTRTEAAHDESNSKKIRLEERLNSLCSEIESKAKAKTETERLSTELAHWNNLSTALGRDGIISLTIDDAGPSISEIANQLLLDCYGPRFSVAITTQHETKIGTTKESFDIRVHDAESGTDKSVSMMSGGEMIWVNESITRGIALYQAQIGGLHHPVLFTDEADGALDLERKQMFVQMKRAVLRHGGYQREYYISHSAEVQSMADAYIDMGQFLTN